MTKEEREQWMLERMQSNPFTFHSLHTRFTVHGWPSGEHPAYREADRLIQRERKSGRISQIKRGLWQWNSKASPETQNE